MGLLWKSCIAEPCFILLVLALAHCHQVIPLSCTKKLKYYWKILHVGLSCRNQCSDVSWRFATAFDTARILLQLCYRSELRMFAKLLQNLLPCHLTCYSKLRLVLNLEFTQLHEHWNNNKRHFVKINQNEGWSSDKGTEMGLKDLSLIPNLVTNLLYKFGRSLNLSWPQFLICKMGLSSTFFFVTEWGFQCFQTLLTEFRWNIEDRHLSFVLFLSHWHKKAVILATCFVLWVTGSYQHLSSMLTKEMSTSNYLECRHIF